MNLEKKSKIIECIRKGFSMPSSSGLLLIAAMGISTFSLVYSVNTLNHVTKIALEKRKEEEKREQDRINFEKIPFVKELSYSQNGIVMGKLNGRNVIFGGGDALYHLYDIFSIEEIVSKSTAHYLDTGKNLSRKEIIEFIGAYNQSASNLQ